MNKELLFKTREEFREWLTINAKNGSGVWLIFGKNKNVKTITANDALEEALCFGWIDGQMKSINEDKYIKYFSPRRSASKWSEKNKKIVEMLCEKGLMTELGSDAINTAKKNGKWNQEIVKMDYEEMINDFQVLLKGKDKALENYIKTSISFKKQLVGFYYSAKQKETREKRLSKIIKVLIENKKQMLY